MEDEQQEQPEPIFTHEQFRELLKELGRRRPPVKCWTCYRARLEREEREKA